MTNVHKYQKIDYNYLRPSISKLNGLQDSKTLNESKSDGQNFKKRNSTEKNSVNHVKHFYSSASTDTQRTQLKSVIEQTQKNGIQLPFHWKNGDTLRFQNFSQNDIGTTVKNINTHINWVNKTSSFKLSPIAANLLSNGYIYIQGIDKQGLAIIVFSIGNLEITEEFIRESQNAFSFVLMTVKKYMMIGDYFEGFNLFVDLNNRNLVLFGNEVFQTFMNVIKDNFMHQNTKMFIYNASLSFGMTWGMMKLTLPNIVNENDLVFVKKGQEEDALGLHFNLDKWEKRFGGKMPDLKKGEFWPMKSHNKYASDIITKQYILKNDIHIFWILDGENDSKIWLFENDFSQYANNISLYNSRLKEHEFIQIKEEKVTLDLSPYNSPKTDKEMFSNEISDATPNFNNRNGNTSEIEIEKHNISDTNITPLKISEASKLFNKVGNIAKFLKRSNEQNKISDTSKISNNISDTKQISHMISVENPKIEFPEDHNQKKLADNEHLRHKKPHKRWWQKINPFESVGCCYKSKYRPNEEAILQVNSYFKNTDLCSNNTDYTDPKDQEKNTAARRTQMTEYDSFNNPFKGNK